MNIKQLIGAALAIIVLCTGVGLYLGTTHAPQKSPPAGALAGPDIPFTYIHWGAGLGIFDNPTVIALNTATTTVCAIQSPAATSTLVAGGVQFTTSSTTATTVTLAKATTAFATTTVLTSSAVSAGAQGTLTASTSPSSVLDPAQVFGPNTWFVIGMQGNKGTFSPVGRCWADFQTFGL